MQVLSEYTNFKDNLIKHKCLCCSKNYQNFDENLKKKFLNKFKFSNHDINKFILLLRKVFTLVNIWMIGENSMKRCYLKKKIFTVTLTFENFQNMCYELCELDPAQFFHCTRSSMASSLKTEQIKIRSFN